MKMKMELSDFLAQHGIKHAATTANTTAVVVAVPRELDPIRLIGDEDKHATLLFFGETATLPPEAKATITDALEQASKLFNPFGESILDVSRLGPETPPALVAKLSNKCLTTIRSVIQINPQVREYLKNAQQFPQFTPHVTLGYPDYQGEADIKAQAAQIYKIQFDKLALWWNDEHIEFNLNQDMAENVEHSDNRVVDFLAHHGVKGMKWGVRKTRTGAVKARATLGRRDRRAQKWAMTAESKAYSKVYRRSASRIRQGTRKLNKSSMFAGQDFTHDSPLRRAYYDAYSKMVSNQLNATVSSRSMILPWRRLGMSPNKRLELHFTYDTSREAAPKVTIRRTDTRSGISDQSSAAKSARDTVKHAATSDDSFPDLEVTLVLDDNGYVTDLDVPVDPDDPDGTAIEHSDELVDAFLAHHGIKGMKWGIRRSEATLDKAAGRKPGTDNSGKSRADKGSMSKMKAGSVVTMLDEHGNPKTMIKKKDGTWHETFLSADAERLIKTSQKEGHELSTREIQEAVNRANFIKNYEAMFAPNPNAELQNRVNSLKLQKDYLQLHAELNPKRPSAVSRLVAGTAGAYSAYSKLDKVVGGELSKGLGKKLGDVLDPVAAANKLAKEATKDALDATKTEASVKKAVAEAQKASTEAQLAVLKLKKAQGSP